MNILQFLNRYYKGLKISVIILYSFTFIPLALIFTIFLEDYWYYYCFSFMLAILTSWIFFGVFQDILKSGYDRNRLYVEYELLLTLISISYIVLPLMIFDFFDFFIVNIMDVFFQEGLSLYGGYSGPNVLISILLFIIFSNIYQAILRHKPC